MRASARSAFFVLVLADVRAEAEAALADAAADDVLEAVEGAGADEQDVRRVDLDQLLLRAVARAVGRDRRVLALEDLEQRLLHALARDVARHRRPAALAGDLVDLVDADDAAAGLLDVAAGVAVERLDDALDVLADVAGLGQRRGVGDRERDVELLGQRLRQQRLAAAGRAEQQDVALLDLDVARLAVLSDALVVVVDGDRQRLLGAVLADDVACRALRRSRAGAGYFGRSAASSLAMMSLHRATHSSQMKTRGPEMSLRTSRRRFPQKEQWKSSIKRRVLHQVRADAKRPLVISGRQRVKLGRRCGPRNSQPAWSLLRLDFRRLIRAAVARRGSTDTVAPNMRALVVTSNPATASAEPESPASALNDLGCESRRGRIRHRPAARGHRAVSARPWSWWMRGPTSR